MRDEGTTDARRALTEAGQGERRIDESKIAGISAAKIVDNTIHIISGSRSIRRSLHRNMCNPRIDPQRKAKTRDGLAIKRKLILAQQQLA